ncbi:cytochrome P450 [Gamsiella multidivaricata]|uniref:cytochrome P450 n=1 Tax=Gamsiella multidivaricata TaxID=101098 RepID=UPI002220C9C0|nr:cytochrome P450 [Gamsiella multidivaricata]KAG0357223.1 hypothetical protein BGZ54_000400 [Gamsiella multidivaricata]KAI7823791.1 cytochrome P450 [Gamsiella multidivaricata]
MIGLLSSSASPNPSEILKVALPIGLGLASAAYLTMKAVNKEGYSTDKSIPTVPVRAGDTTHDTEYFEDQDEFLRRCEAQYGPVFNCRILNQSQTVVSGPLTREVFMNEDFSFSDAINDMTGLRAFITSVIKSNRDPDNRTTHEVIRDNLSPNLPLFTPRIVNVLQTVVDSQLGHCENKLVENPLSIFQDMIAGAMATVFMGPELAKNRAVIDTFIQCTYDFGKVLGRGRNTFWHAFNTRTRYGYMNPLRKHMEVLVQAAAPVVLERRRQEQEAADKGLEWERPLDIMQRLLDNFDKYGFVDLEDVCGHLLLLVLASVHTTSDTSTNLCYYLAAFPEYTEPLYQEQQEILDLISKERQEIRQKKLDSGEVASAKDFEGTELDPKNDRDLSAAAMKRMAKMDSFVREVFRYRVERLSLPHAARRNVQLSNGMVISKGSKAVINMRSIHQDSGLQGEDALEFRPWRFVGKSKAATKASGDFLTWGMGRHACPGRFLAIQELKTIGVLMVRNYSKIEIQDPSKTKAILLSRIGDPVTTGLIFHSRNKNATEI